MAHQNSGSADSRPARLLVPLLFVVIFIPFAFSAELSEAVHESITGNWPIPGRYWWSLLVVDAALSLVILALLLGLRWRRRLILGWWAVSTVVTLGLDYVLRQPLRAASMWIHLLGNVGYVLALAILVALAIETTAQPGSARRDTWSRFGPAIPLLVGTLAAYLGTMLWERGLAGSDGLADIGSDYFAQLSQIIPTLLVALAIEDRFFRRSPRGPVRSATTLVSLLVISLGEVLAISGLLHLPGEPGTALAGWHQFTAFVVTLDAAVVALTAIILSAAADPRERDGGHPQQARIDVPQPPVPGSEAPCQPSDVKQSWVLTAASTLAVVHAVRVTLRRRPHRLPRS